MSKNNRICICACKMTKLTILSSQGSAVTHLRCGGQCNKNFVANLLPNSTVKKFENQLIFARVMDRRTEVPFLTHSVVQTIQRRVYLRNTCLLIICKSSNGNEPVLSMAINPVSYSMCQSLQSLHNILSAIIVNNHLIRSKKCTPDLS